MYLATKVLALLKKQGYENISWFVVCYGGDEAELQDLIVENNLEESFFLLGKRTNPYPIMRSAAFIMGYGLVLFPKRKKLSSKLFSTIKSCSSASSPP